jgi:Kef-type K+ transport system membrane component KefB
VEQVSTINLIAIPLTMALAAAISALLPWLPVPVVVFEIVFGAIIGPHVLGIVYPGVAMDFLASFGLGMLFLMAGFEMNPSILRGRPMRNALIGWGITLVIALAAASAISAAGLGSATLLTTLAVSTSSLGALMPILRDAGMLVPPYGPMVLVAGAIGVAAPLIALSLVLAGGRAPTQAVIMLAFGVGAAGAVIAAARASGGVYARIVERTMRTSGQLPMRLAMCILILLVVLSEQLQIDMVLGAFVAGAVVRMSLRRSCCIAPTCRARSASRSRCIRERNSRLS